VLAWPFPCTVRFFLCSFGFWAICPENWPELFLGRGQPSLLCMSSLLILAALKHWPKLPEWSEVVSRPIMPSLIFGLCGANSIIWMTEQGISNCTMRPNKETVQVNQSRSHDGLLPPLTHEFCILETPSIMTLLFFFCSGYRRFICVPLPGPRHSGPFCWMGHLWSAVWVLADGSSKRTMGSE
jgi:hypothetical protein